MFGKLGIFLEGKSRTSSQLIFICVHPFLSVFIRFKKSSFLTAAQNAGSQHAVGWAACSPPPSPKTTPQEQEFETTYGHRLTQMQRASTRTRPAHNKTASVYTPLPVSICVHLWLILLASLNAKHKQARKSFFSEEKKQKTFISLSCRQHTP